MNPRSGVLVLIGLVLTLLVCTQAAAEDWSLQRLNPFAEKAPPQSSAYRGQSPSAEREQSSSPLAAIGDGVEKIGDGAKELIVGAGDGTKKILVGAGDGTKKILVGTANGTKRIFTGTTNALGLTSPQPPTQPGQFQPWVRDPQTGRYTQAPRRPRKQTWLESLLGPDDPKPAKTWDDWWNLPRNDL